jgi:hypothetical protein
MTCQHRALAEGREVIISSGGRILSSINATASFADFPPY